MEIFEVSPIPSSRMKTGRSASAGVLRNTSSSGSSSASPHRYQPISRPSGTATTIAMAKPVSALARLCSVLLAGLPPEIDVQPRDEGFAAVHAGIVNYTSNQAHREKGDLQFL